ncbi:hypothetical protein QBC41DRAFT_301068 [Cercophora samala]|uniref:Uncharacterized protein n=1 Tax=Cercophora samala TaxID=330535 RepID=A0AA40DEN5_9PEZI|nr:hypothetical protein QBC41DRAFT_301068 [Cercophora samala]
MSAMSNNRGPGLSVEKRVAALTIEQCRAVVINLAQRLDVLEIVITKMLRKASISLHQLRPGCELMRRIAAAKEFQPQGLLAPDLDKHLVDLKVESIVKQLPELVIDLTGDLTIDLTEDDAPNLAKSQVHDLSGLTTCLSDKQFRDLVLELAHNPATAALTQYRLWAAGLGWMAPGSQGLAVAPRMITRMVVSKSVSCSSRNQNGLPPRPLSVGPEKKPSHVRKAVKSGRVNKVARARLTDTQPRSQTKSSTGTKNVDMMEEIWQHAMSGPSKK